MVEGKGDEVEGLVAADRAARIAGESVARWWRALGSAADTAVTRESLDNVLRDALLAMRRRLRADAMAILLADDDGGELVARAASGLSEEVNLALGIRAGQGITGRVMVNRQPVLVDDLAHVDVALPTLAQSGIRSIVAVPLLADDRVLGVMYAGSRRLNRFTPTDTQVLEVIADQLASAFRRVELFEAERAARAEAERVAARLAQMQTVTSMLVGTSTVEETASVLAESLSAHRVGGTRRGSVWLVRGNRLELASALGLAPGIRTLGEVPLDSELPIAVAFRRRQPIYVSGIEQGLAEYPALGGVAGVADSFAALPIVLGHTCLGVLLVRFDDIHQFDGAERDFLAAVVDQAAQALDRATLYSQLADLAEISSFFAQVAKVMAEASDFADTLDRLATLALPALGDICLVDVVGEHSRLERMVARHRDPTRQPLVDILRTEYPPLTWEEARATEADHRVGTQWSAMMTDEFLRAATRDETHFALTKALGFQSYLAVPLVSGRELLGSVTFISSDRPFEQADVSFAERLAQQVASVIANARRSDAALETSHVLQQSLLPQRLPDVDGLRVETRYLTATRGLEVGGDFYDVAVLPNGKVAFTIGDVAGHDRQAAASMGRLRSVARALAGQVGSPGELVDALRQSWDLVDFDRIATALFGQFDPATGAMVMASAGHYPPLLVGPEGATFLAVPPSTPLGAPATAVRQWSGTLTSDHVLVLYTDGAIDERFSGSAASMTRMADAASTGPMDPVSVCQRVVDLLDEDRIDDVALLALAYDHPAPRPRHRTSSATRGRPAGVGAPAPRWRPSLGPPWWRPHPGSVTRGRSRN